MLVRIPENLATSRGSFSLWGGGRCFSKYGINSREKVRPYKNRSDRDLKEN